MISSFQHLHPTIQALIAGIFTWGLTAFGAFFVFITKEFRQKIFDFFLGFAGGIMIAASIWSLLIPGLEMSSHLKPFSWFPVAIGFLLGSFVLKTVDKILPHLHLGFSTENSEGIKTSWQRSVLLVLALTLHNIPEGLSIGVAIGALYTMLGDVSITPVLALTIGIGIQNIPEGFAVAISLRREKLSKFKSFWYGQLSGIVEPFFAIVGAWTVFATKSLLPYTLGFAAGAMMFVVIEEVIPESQRNNNIDLATTGILLGFLIMMVLDVMFSK